MPTAGDQLPGGVTGLARRVADLARDLRELRAARRLESASIGAGGLRVVAGGRFAMDGVIGTRMVDIGAINSAAYNNVDGSPQQATFFRRQDGSLAISVFAGPGGSQQFFGLWDAQGHIVMGDDVSGRGIAHPYLPVALGLGFDGGWDYWPRTVSASMVELWNGGIYAQQPRLVVVVRASADASGTTGQVQLAINGTVVGSPQTVGFAANYYTLGPVSLAAYEHMQQLQIQVMARRTAGTGAIRASLYSAYTLES